MKMPTSLVLISLVLAAGTAQAAAPQNASKTQPTAGMQAMDHSVMEGQMDHDQTTHEAAPAGQGDAEFVALDKNKDGKITKAELPTTHPLAPHFEMLDTNRDGALSPAEFAKRHAM